MAEPSPRASLFAKSVHKHLSRAHEKVLQRLGKADETRDEQFEQMAQDFTQQQTESSRLNRDLRAYLASIKALHESSGRLWESLLLLSDDELPERETLSSVAETTELLWDDYHQKLWDQTVPVLETHQAPFNDIKARMSKRARKLVDVDGARHHLQALQAAKRRDDAKIAKAEEDLQKAQRVFEEINSELQDELPALFTSRVGVYVSTLQNMAGVEENVYRELSKLSKQLYEVMHKVCQHHVSQNNTRPPRHAPSGESNRRSQGSLKEAPSPGGQTPPRHPQRSPSHTDQSAAPPTVTPTRPLTMPPTGTPTETPTRPPTRPLTMPPKGSPLAPLTVTPAETPTETPADNSTVPPPTETPTVPPTGPPTVTTTETPTETTAETPTGTPKRAPTLPTTGPPTLPTTGPPTRPHTVPPTETHVVPPKETPVTEPPTLPPTLPPTVPPTVPPAAVPVPRPRCSTSSTTVQGEKKTPPARPPPRRSQVGHSVGDPAWGAANGHPPSAAPPDAPSAHPGDASGPDPHAATATAAGDTTTASEDVCREPKLASEDLSAEDKSASQDVTGVTVAASEDLSGETKAASEDVPRGPRPAAEDVSIAGEDVSVEDDAASRVVTREYKSTSVDVSRVTSVVSEAHVPSEASADFPAQDGAAKAAAEDLDGRDGVTEKASEDFPGRDDDSSQAASEDFSASTGKVSADAPSVTAAPTSSAVAEAASEDFLAGGNPAAVAQTASADVAETAATCKASEDFSASDKGTSEDVSPASNAAPESVRPPAAAAESSEGAARNVEETRGESGRDADGGGGGAAAERNGDTAELSLPPGFLFKVLASHDYDAADTDELSFVDGDVLLVLEAPRGHQQDDGWLLGMREEAWLRHRTVGGHSGVFPLNFTSPAPP